MCRRWNDLLKRPSSFGALWKEVVIDFGHGKWPAIKSKSEKRGNAQFGKLSAELITSVHTPIEWSDKRPNDHDFRESFAKTQLNSSRILSFVNTRASCIRSLRLVNSEGYYSGDGSPGYHQRQQHFDMRNPARCAAEDGDFVNLQNKHNFTLGHLGMLLGLLSPRLTELSIGHCTDFFVMGAVFCVTCRAGMAEKF